MSGSTAPDPDTAVAEFLACRPRMLGIAYRMLGTLADAEDIIQEAYERWHVVAAKQRVEDSTALLATLTTRLCIDRYRRERTRREAYPGPWLPEPVPTAVDAPLAALETERMLSLGLLRVMEHLTPLERAAFVLADAFDYRAREIASVLGRSEAHCRQLLHRARKSLASLPPEHEDVCGSVGGYQEGLRLLTALLDAVRDGNVEETERLLAADVVLYSDGGGSVAAVTRPVQGPRAVARLCIGLARQLAGPPALHYACLAVNGSASLVVHDNQSIESVIVVEHAGGRVRGAFVQRNPDKLSRLMESVPGRPTNRSPNHFQYHPDP